MLNNASFDNTALRKCRAAIPCRGLNWILIAALSVSAGGCCHWGARSPDELAAAQIHARDMYSENQQLLAARMQNEQLLAGLESEKQMLMDHLSGVESQLQTANQRVDNLLAERGELTDRFAKSLTDNSPVLVGGGTSLEAQGFQYDPATGLNKFRKDILFDLGSDVLRPEADPTLSEFASSVKSGAAAGMKILIVGHTDDQQIVRPETARQHPTNWHLSTDRSAAVILALTKLGVDPHRVASMGYSEFHALEPSASDTARQRNRRVELYVVPNDPSVAAIWDPVSSIR